MMLLPWATKFLPLQTVDREATSIHLALYARLKSEGYGTPGAYGRGWTREQSLALGRTYIAAHGRLPATPHMRAAFGLPPAQTIKRLFGSKLAFHLALQEGEV